jgi:hypothetical protein
LITKLSKKDKGAYRAMNKKHGITYGGPSTLALYWTYGTKIYARLANL